jgi:hypothetical protein
MTQDELEAAACIPHPISPVGFNPHVVMPYGCTIEHIRLAMSEFIDFLGFVNTQLRSRNFPRLESFLMPANFSSMVGEFMAAGIPKHCSGLVRNKYHNGHPDMLPAGRFPRDAALHAPEGIEIKASRYMRGWQGHNPENVWLMVFVFDGNTSRDEALEIAPRPFRIIKVVGALLVNEDWKFSGRSATSRRTITASVTPSGYEKMQRNWIYQDPEPLPRRRRLKRRI